MRKKLFVLLMVFAVFFSLGTSVFAKEFNFDLKDGNFFGVLTSSGDYDKLNFNPYEIIGKTLYFQLHGPSTSVYKVQLYEGSSSKKTLDQGDIGIYSNFIAGKNYYFRISTKKFDKNSNDRDYKLSVWYYNTNNQKVYITK
ncbi:hypothetical protein LQV63_10310 [Paenibacillus profundus]|uniref:Uncharacterized protein n=1 Tax=Paenibacillus profundus TaxID=1173085 RepID=A0ABS8YCG2_9BACL|nr:MULTISPECIES: hypothetical protein [Paenibacillus]MCE5169706.1 hypothetical protein [Paenibacillus profundus]MCM3341032.1 hypothetical protein [Paenibacillus sp. MER TA 81-3]